MRSRNGTLASLFLLTILPASVPPVALAAPPAPAEETAVGLDDGRAGMALLDVEPEKAAPAAPRPRIKVTAPDPEDEAIKDLVERTTAAVNAEDLDGVLACIRPGRHGTHRRRLGILFVSHAVSLDLEDSHILSRRGARAEVGVKYTLTLSQNAHDFVSILILSRSDTGGWFIDREAIQSVNSRADSYSSEGCRGGVICVGGRCALQ